jgi:N utilization substance protein B
VTKQHSPSPAQPVLAQRRKARRLVLQALYQQQMTGAEATDIEAQFRAEFTGKTDWDYFHEAFAAIAAQLQELDALLEPYLDRKIKSLDPISLALLRLGVYELRDRIDIPSRVTINECIELAKSFGATDSHKYVNGLLDKLAKALRPLETGRAARD